MYHRQQQLMVHLVESIAVNVKGLKCISGYLGVDVAASFHLCEVANPAQEGIGYTWGPAAAHGNLVGCLAGTFYSEESRRAQDNAFKHLVAVIFQVAVYAEAGTHRGSEHA